nr:hypothetical protein [Rubricoccus marinus]
MLRLSTPGFSRFTQSDRFDATYGGGEANVAVSLAHFGHDARFVCKLPTHEIGRRPSTNSAATAWTPASSPEAATGWASTSWRPARASGRARSSTTARTAP